MMKRLLNILLFLSIVHWGHTQDMDRTVLREFRVTWGGCGTCPITVTINVGSQSKQVTGSGNDVRNVTFSCPSTGSWGSTQDDDCCGVSVSELSPIVALVPDLGTLVTVPAGELNLCTSITYKIDQSAPRIDWFLGNTQVGTTFNPSTNFTLNRSGLSPSLDGESLRAIPVVSGCSFASEASNFLVVRLPDAPPNIQSVTYGSTCNSATDGKLFVTVNGGASGSIQAFALLTADDGCFLGDWTSCPSTNSPVIPHTGGSTVVTIPGVGPGRYTVRVANTNGTECFDEFFTGTFIDETLSFTTSDTKSTCRGGNDGRISVNISTGGSFDIHLNGTRVLQNRSGGASHTITGSPTNPISQGSNSIKVTRRNCSRGTTKNETVAPGTTVLDFSSVLPMDPTCLNPANGKILVDIPATIGGTFDFFQNGVLIHDNTSASSVMFQDLAPEVDYTISITSSLGCDLPTPAIRSLNTPGDFTVLADSAIPGACDMADIQLSVDVIQASTFDDNYSYRILDGVTEVKTGNATSSSFVVDVDDVGNGTYTVELTDNCRVSPNDIKPDDATVPAFELIQVVEGPPLYTSDNEGITYNFQCKGEAAPVSLTVSRGSGQYIIDYEGFPSRNINTTPEIFMISQSGDTDTYTYSIQDANCPEIELVDQDISLLQPTSLLAVDPPAPDVVAVAAIAANSVDLNVTCVDGSNGSVDVLAVGGIKPYAYHLNSSEGNSSQSGSGSSANNVQEMVTFNGLRATPPGMDATLIDHEIYVIDDIGCERPTPRFIRNLNEPLALAIESISTSFRFNNKGTDYHFKCKDDDVVMTVITSGAVFPHNIKLFEGLNELQSTTVDKADVTSGITFLINQVEVTKTYTVQVTDPLCQVPVEQDFTMNEAPERFENLRLAALDYGKGFNVRCNQGSDGRIQVDLDGGVDDFTYQLTADDPAFTLQSVTSIGRNHTFTGLRATTVGGAPITYTVNVNDALGCALPPQTISLTQPEPIVIGSVVLQDFNGFEIPCTGFDVPARFQVTGGARLDGAVPYVAILESVSGNGYSSSTPGFDTPQDQFVFDGVIAGTYRITIRDFFGNTCEQVINPYFTADEPLPLTLDVISTQFPECLGHVDGEVTLEGDEGVPFPGVGVDKYTFEIIASNPVTPLYQSTDFTPTVTGAQATFSLPSGDYTAEVTDINLCKTTVDFTIPINPMPIALTIDQISDVNGFNVSCFGGDDGYITVSASGGDPIGGDYIFTLDGDPDLLSAPIVKQGTTVTFDGLKATKATGLTNENPYTIYVTDANSCEEDFVNSTNYKLRDLTSPTPMIVSSVANETFRPTCFNATDGRLSILVDGGVQPIQFLVDGLDTDYRFGDTANTLILDQVPGDSIFHISVRDAN